MFTGLLDESTQGESQQNQIIDDGKTMINYIRFKELLLRLGMIMGVAGTPYEIQESNLILELWQLTSQNHQSDQIAEEVLLKDAKSVIMSVLRLNESSLEKKKLNEDLQMQ